MSNIGKKTLTRSRDKLFSRVTRATDKLDQTTARIENQLSDLVSKMDLDNIDKQFNSGSTIFQVSDHEIIAKTFSGTKISLNPEDISVTPHLALDGVWEKEVTRAWLTILSPSDTVLDIGANFGYYGLLAAQQTHVSKSKVYFFEANPKLIPYINKTLSINNYYEHSIVENLAVAEKEGTVKLNVLKDHIGSSSLHSIKHLNAYVGEKIHLETDEIIEIKAVTVDSYCRENKIEAVDLIKMDIEGYEDKAYKGMRDVVRKSPNVTMFIEFTKNSYENPEEFYNEMLNDFGSVYLILPDGVLQKAPSSNYKKLLGGLDDWIMLVFTKKEELIKKS